MNRRREPASPPLRVAGVLMAVGLVLGTGALPAHAAAAVPVAAAPAGCGTGDSGRTTSTGPATGPATATPSRPSPSATSAPAGDTAQTFGVAPPDDQGRSLSASTTSDLSPGDCPLPRTGNDDTLVRFALAVALLFGGLAVLAMIGFSGARPWPGRYVRRD